MKAKDTINTEKLAGMRVVVEWITSNPEFRVHILHHLKEWQAKLKEWGIELS